MTCRHCTNPDCSRCTKCFWPECRCHCIGLCGICHKLFCYADDTPCHGEHCHAAHLPGIDSEAAFLRREAEQEAAWDNWRD